MCQENNSAEAKLQKINKITALFSPGLQHTLLLGPPAETPEPAGIHRAPQQVMAPNPHGWGCHPSDSTHPEEPRGALAGQDATNTGVVVVPPPPQPGAPGSASPRPAAVPRWRADAHNGAAVSRRCSALTFFKKAIRGR